MNQPATAWSIARLALAFAAFAACGANEPSAEDRLLQALDDRHFVANEVQENGVPRELVADTSLELEFFAASKQFSARSSCNRIGGPLRVVSSQLVIDYFGRTERGCARDVAVQEEWYFAFLSSDPILKLQGNELVLSSPTTSITYLERLNPDRELLGTVWQMNAILDNRAAITAPWEHPATLRLAADGTAIYTVNDNALSFELGGFDDSDCAGESIDLLEAGFHRVLGEPTPLSVAIDGSKLTLTRGDAGLLFYAAK